MSETRPARQLTVGKVAWRYVSGDALFARRRTNATVWRKGDTAVIPHDRPGRWSYLPRYQRAGIRVGGTTYALALIWAWFYMQWLVWATVIALILFAVISIALMIVERRRNTAATRMPNRVKYRQMAKHFDAGSEATPIIGMSYGNRLVRLDLDNEAPHIAASMGVGAGKSSMLRGIIAQGLHDGWEHVTIIDPKYVSLAEFKDHPRVTYCQTWPDQWDAMTREQLIMDERYTQLAADNTLTFRRRVIVMEEGNSWAAEMKMYWVQHLRGKGMAPVLQTLAFILFKGRQCNVNVIGVWQRLGVNAVGSPDARDQFGCKILGRFTPSAWKSVVGLTPIPGSPRHKGRALMVVGEEIEYVQLAFWTPKQARDYADAGEYVEEELPIIDVMNSTDGTETEHTPDQRSGDSGVPSTVSDTHATQETDMNADTPDTAVMPAMTLEEALAAGIVTDISIGGLRTARARPGFPKPTGKRGRSLLYPGKALQAWNERRIGGTS